MEGLFIIFSEAIASLIAPLLHAVIALIIAVASIISELVALIIHLIARWRRGGQPVSEEPATPRPPRRWRRIGLVMMVLVGIIGCSILVLERVFDEALVRWSLRRQGEKSGLHIEPTTVDASLWRGRIALSNATVRYTGEGLSCDLTVHRAAIRLNLWSTLTGWVQIDEVEVDGVRGQVISALGLPLPKQRTTFVIGRVAISDLALDLQVAALGRRLAGPLLVERGEMAPVDSASLVFDLLFRSTITGRYLDAPVAIASRAEGPGRITTWRIGALPVAVLAVHLGAPWDALQAGYVDVEVDDHWNLGEPRMVTADYRLHFYELSVHAEPGASLLTRSVATGLDALVRGNGGVLDLHGTMQIDASTCSGSLSLDAQLVGRLLFDATLEQLGLSPAEKLALKALLPQAKEWGRALLDRWRTAKP